jgi:hypothetical protein
MQSSQELAYAAHKRLYWQRNALPTCAVLLVVVFLSALIRPLNWHLVLGCSLGGVLLFVGVALAEGPRVLVALLFALGSVFVVVWSIAVYGVLRGPLMWAQGMALFGAAALACMAVAQSLVVRKGKQREG